MALMVFSTLYHLDLLAMSKAFVELTYGKSGLCCSQFSQPVEGEPSLRPKPENDTLFKVGRGGGTNKVLIATHKPSLNYFPNMAQFLTDKD